MISGVAGGLGAALDDETAGRLAAWFDLIATWNAKVDLTAARTSEELADLMLADALVLARHEPPDRRVVDVGSGAGGPGLALHLTRTDLAMTLVEPLQKRVSFLRTVAGALGTRAGSLRVVRARGEDLPNSRTAVRHGGVAGHAPPRRMAPSRRTPRCAEGAIWVLLAREAPPDLAGWTVRIDERYTWPLTGASRRALRYEHS